MARVELVNREGSYASYRVHHRGNRYLAAVIGSQPKRLGLLDADGQFDEIEICPPGLARAIFGAIQRHEARKPVTLWHWVWCLTSALAAYTAVSMLISS